MPLSTTAPRPDSAPHSTAGAAEREELRKKLLDMIRRNESERRKTEK